MGIFGKLFKKTEINKCEICGEIIHSDIIEPCLSCRKKVGTKAYHEGEFKDDQQVGLRKVYYENGQLEFEGEYKDGKKVGLWKYYHENGQEAISVGYKDGKRVGLCKNYHENGQLETEGEAKDGKKVGLWKMYHQNGELKAEMTYTNGVQDNGDVISYHDNGIKARKITLENHLKNGPYYEWHRNSQLKTEGIYNDEVPTVLKEWDEDGVLIIAEWTNSEKEEYLNQSSKINTKLLYDLREEYFQLDDNENYPEAIKRLTQIIEQIPLLKGQSFIAYVDPSDMLNGILLDEIYFNRSQLYSKLNLIEEAKNDLIKAIKSNLNRKEALYHHHLGCTMIQCGDFTSCIEHFNLAIEIDPDTYNSYYMRAVAYCSDKSELTDVNQAIDDLKKYLEYDPDDVAALNLLNVLLKNIEETPPPILKFNNETLRAAVNDWLEDDKKAEAKYGHISGWDTSEVTDMESLFYGAHTFNEPIGNWDVSNVTDMSFMFGEAMLGYFSFNQPIGNWNVSNVTDMNCMFKGAKSFNQPIGNWDVSSVKSMIEMFIDAEAFNQPIGNWNVSNVTNMKNMFGFAKAFNQPIGNWDVSSVTDMSLMFRLAVNFNQPIGNWDVSKVVVMRCMFFEATAFNQPIGNWDVSIVTDMCHMFEDANSFNQPIGNWNVSSVTDMEDMFKGAETFNQDIGSWEVKKAEEEEEVSKDKIDENNYGRQAISIQLLDFNENNSSESFINGETRSIKDHETCQELKFSHEGFLSDQHQKFWGYTNEDISNETEEYQRSAMMIGEFSYWEEICEYLKLSEMVEDEDENILANENLFNEAIASCKVPTNKEMKLMDGLKYAFQDCFILTEKNSQYFYKLLNFFSYALFIDEKFQAEDSESFIELIKKKTKESNPIVINIIAYSTADIT